MVHERFDIEKFKAIFPLAKLRQEAREAILDRQRKQPGAYYNAADVEDHIRLLEPHGEIIFGPQTISDVEQLRAEALAGSPEPDRIPAHAFIFGRGEPADPRCTKIGGKPFWPKDQKWPRKWSLMGRGEPMQFLAQICFADSLSLFDRQLPGDLLVIFGDPIERSSETLQCHWVQTDGCIPIDPQEVPQFENDPLPQFGFLHATYDYVHAVQNFARDRYPNRLHCIEGTKIGGLPRWIQEPEKSPAGFLCALGSTFPHEDKPYPYVNVEAPIGFREAHGDKQLMWGDVGSVYFFLGKDGELQWTEQYY